MQCRLPTCGSNGKKSAEQQHVHTESATASCVCAKREIVHTDRMSVSDEFPNDFDIYIIKDKTVDSLANTCVCAIQFDIVYFRPNSSRWPDKYTRM